MNTTRQEEAAVEQADLAAALERSVAACRTHWAPDPDLGLPDLSDALHGPDGTLQRSIWGLGSPERGAILTAARTGTVTWAPGYGYRPNEYLVATEPGQLALTDAGAELAWHATDSDRGLHRPLHAHWATNAEARRRSLDTYQDPTVWYWDGQQLTEWHHP